MKKNLFCTEMKILKCNQCDKTFTIKLGMIDLSNTILDSIHLFVAFVRKVSVKYNYDLHVRAHEARSYGCNYCGKVFKTKQNDITNLNTPGSIGSDVTNVKKDSMKSLLTLNNCT